MMKVPHFVTIEAPIDLCPDLPVLLTNRTVIDSGACYVMSFSRHSWIVNCGSPNSYSANSTASVPV